MCFLLFFLGSVLALVAGQDTFYFIQPQNKSVSQGSEVKLTCDVSERRHIYFQWTQNGKLLPNTTRKYQEDSNLRILRVLREEDTGPFTCVATNSSSLFSSESQEAYLNIQWINRTAHVLLKRPRKDKVEAGSDVILSCDVTGFPKPKILWFHNTYRLFPTDKIRILDKSRLKLQNVSAGENGVYSCKGENNAGTAETGEKFVLNMNYSDTAHLQEDGFTISRLALKYQPARLDCPFENAASIQWFEDQHKLFNETDRHVIYPNGSLYFPRVRHGDKGVYLCQGLSSQGPAHPTQTFTAELALSYLDDIVPQSFEPRLQPSFPIVIPNNQRFEIKVFPPKGLPLPDYRWLDKNDQVVGDLGLIHMSGNNLVFEEPKEINSGNYTFVASNTAGEKRRSLWIIVSVPPIISRVPTNVLAQEDKRAMFSCRVTGTQWPVTTIVWLRNGMLLPLTSREFRINQRDGTLLIPHVKGSHSGNYSCLANTTGQVPQVSRIAVLTVQRKLKFKPPLASTYYLELDQPGSITCRAEAVSEPKITWFRVKEDGKIGSMLAQQPTLNFKRVEREDEGVYVCVAQHHSQGFINQTINVRIVEKPTFSIRPANSTTAFEGQPTMLHCVAVGDPRPHVVWDKDGRVIATSARPKVGKGRGDRYTIFSNGTLLVRKVYMEDKGRYGCSANNSAGQIRTEFSLTITQPVEEDEGFDMAKTVIIAVCSAGAYLALVIGLTAFCSYRLLMQRRLTRKQMMNAKNLKPLAGSDFQHHREQHELLMKDRDSGLQFRSDSDNRSHASALSSQPSQSSASATAPSSLAAALAMRSRGVGVERFQFPRQDLQTLGIIGKGQFGDVFLAKARAIRPMETETLVVVKSLLVKGDQSSVDFHNEMDMYSKLEHQNIARLLGVCREGEPFFMITEYCDWGDLKQFLLAMRTDNGRRPMGPRVPPLTSVQKLKLCQQVALGMEYLSGSKFIHRDLAARNILLTSRFDLKICSLSLCRDVYAGEYFHHPTRQVPVPLRWLPPEAVRDSEYSFHTDIWSYGVFMWELFHLGDLPYRLIPDDDLYKALCGQNGGSANLTPGGVSTMQLPRLDFADHCPAHLVDIVRQCCAVLPSKRPTFSDVVVTLGLVLNNGDCV